MASSPGLLLLLLGHFLAFTEGESRCYCNEAGCVSTGYMCKSIVGQCYTMVDFSGQATHGCADALIPDMRSHCVNGEQLVGTSREGDTTQPLFLCCAEDMCNYIDTIDISVISQSKTNSSLQKDSPSSLGGQHVVYSRNFKERSSDGDLWFKAAVIAVPIAGIFILVMLVLMAMRMLRADSGRDRRLLYSRHGRGVAKTRLYVADHFPMGKKAVNDCSLFSSDAPEACGVHKFRHKHRHNECFADVGCSVDRGKETKVDKQGRVYEKVCEKGPDTTRGIMTHTSSALVIWEDDFQPTDSATVV